MSVENAREIPASSATSARGFFALLLGLFVCLGATFGIWQSIDLAIPPDLWLAIPLPKIVVIVGAAATGVIISAALLFKLWSHPFRQLHSGIGGGLVLIGLLGLAAEGIAVAASIFHMPTLVRTEQAALREFSGYSLTGNARSKTVYLDGPIGLGLLRRLKDFEKQYGSVAVFEINSHGGLVDEALGVAQFVESRSTKVIARENCDSACILIAVASKESYADEELDFGFHSVYSTVDSDSEFVTYQTNLGGVEARSFLLGHHVPADIVDEAAKVGSDELIYIPAQSLLNSGALKGLLR